MNLFILGRNQKVVKREIKTWQKDMQGGMSLSQHCKEHCCMSFNAITVIKIPTIVAIANPIVTTGYHKLLGIPLRKTMDETEKHLKVQRCEKRQIQRESTTGKVQRIRTNSLMQAGESQLVLATFGGGVMPVDC